jgi:L-iditol 2-dehydrogenase
VGIVLSFPANGRRILHPSPSDDDLSTKTQPRLDLAAVIEPELMRALVLEEPGSLGLREIPIPTPGDGEILVRVVAATTCGTDLKAYLRGHPQIPMPGVLGHEYSGVVQSAGEGARFDPGEAIMGVHSAPCGRCRWCLRDQENLCESLMSTKVLGSYAEYLLIPERIARKNVFHKPDNLSFEIASLLEPLSCVAEGIRSLHPHRDDRVLVIGPGAIGLMFVAALRLQGIEDVTLAGRNVARLAVGEKLGAKANQLSDVAEADFDVVIECTGTVEIWEKSLSYVRRGGKIVLFGGCPSGTSACFDTKRVHYDQITLLSPFHFGTEAVRNAREWLLDPRLDLSPLISGERRLEDGPATFEDLRAGRGLKYVFRP